LNGEDLELLLVIHRWFILAKINITLDTLLLLNRITFCTQFARYFFPASISVADPILFFVNLGIDQQPPYTKVSRKNQIMCAQQQHTYF